MLVDLSAAILCVNDDTLAVRLVPNPERLPFGSFFPAEHRTMEIGLRRWVEQQVDVRLAHVEQLYTFGDRGRQRADGSDTHIVSVGYLALTGCEAVTEDSLWRSVYDFFPWEDWRGGRPSMLDKEILPRLKRFATSKAAKQRLQAVFGNAPAPWDEELVLDRYELLYEAGLVAEACHDGGGDAPPLALGAPLELDHRRILATALSRLRGKMKYRPVIFDFMADAFTQTELQKTAEAVLGANLHKQNFRRLLTKSKLLESTGTMARARGRPAELFRFRQDIRAQRPQLGLRITPTRHSR